PLHGPSGREAAGVVVAENQALEVIARTAGFPLGAGGCFVAGGSAGNLSALVVARDTVRHRRGGADPPAGPLIGVEALIIPTEDHRLNGAALRAVLDHHDRADDVIAVVATAGTTNAGIVDD